MKTPTRTLTAMGMLPKRHKDDRQRDAESQQKGFRIPPLNPKKRVKAQKRKGGKA